MWIVVHSRPCANCTCCCCFPPIPSPEQNAVQILFLNSDADGWRWSRPEERRTPLLSFVCMLFCLCQSVSSYGAVLTRVDVNPWSWSFLLGLSSRIFSQEGLLAAGFFLGGYGLFPQNHCFVLPQLHRLLASCLICLFLLLLLSTCDCGRELLLLLICVAVGVHSRQYRI